MPEFNYDGKTITYHSFNDDAEKCIIPLGKPGGKKLSLYEFAGVFGTPDSRGFRFKVLWTDYDNERNYDRACETMQMMTKEGTEKSNFIIFDEEGARILSEIVKQNSDCVERIFADGGSQKEIGTVFKDIAGMPEIEYFSATDLNGLLFAVKCALFGQKMKCPYCGEPMQMGYIYANQSIQAYWTMDPDLVGYGNELNKESVLPLREDFTDCNTLKGLIRTLTPEDISKGFLCRRCGKMVVDMSPALIHFRDKTFLEANDLSPDFGDGQGEDLGDKITGAFAAWGDSFRNVFARKHEPGKLSATEKIEREEREAERRLASEDGETRKRGLFGPKVE